ncbi:Uncharacterised protein [Bordetella pertussis]|nr:Uncharacterised protein [Bordetella pertussis]CPP85820.1 Uncharacterised protein [Bordetella pertussis]CRE31451.1 Uncharacterised protein [Bordetella pertussis]CRE32026.1 Uncharacterised protein [Bordetella pertussis]CRE32527.1 Uncharacterised protein [Bordetella pertussis]
MRGLWRQVKHVARFEHVFFLGLEPAEDLQRQVRLQRQVFLPAVAPAAAPAGLQQEDVIAVEVRPHAAAIAGHADHDVVQARVRNEAELLQQGADGVVMQVHALHQQGPVRLARLGQAGERAVLHVPLALFAPDQSRFDVVAARQLAQGGDAGRRLEAGDGLADQQGFALPVAAHEVGGGKPAQQGERGGRVHVRCCLRR